jgi:hypothetical protein
MTRRFTRALGAAFGAAALVAAGFWLGRTGETPLAAQQPQAPATGVAPAAYTPVTVEGSKRVVAYVYNNIPITREEYGDYLINLLGHERLELYVNKRIIEIECAKRGIDVTPQEIEATILEDCEKIKVSRDDFIRNVLAKRYGKTIEEWCNDVIKPRLLLAKLCRDKVNAEVTDLEMKQMFENRYGEKAKCKIILWPKDQRDVAYKLYGQLRGEVTDGTIDQAKAEAAWNSVATRQPDSTLAARAGEIEPIGRFSGPDSAKVEEIAFNLKVGEVSPLIELPIGWLVVRRFGTIPPDKAVNIEKVKADLRKEVVDRKIDKEVPKLFTAMKDEAKPLLLLTKRMTLPEAPKKK